MTAEPTGRRGWLWSGDFGRFWLGQTISNLGSSFTFFALPLLVFKLTGSPLNLGLTAAFEFVPYLLFGLVIGAWVDRVDRRRLMIATDLARAAVIAVIPRAGRRRRAVGRLGLCGRLRQRHPDHRLRRRPSSPRSRAWSPPATTW